MINFNKAAMFGLESRALKKQFGKLFLARMQSVGSKETRGAGIQSNRAAMFGLDARIALAIFGALSVISGAALYSAIKDAKTTAAYQQITEMSKASEAYYLDTGSPLFNMSNHPYDLNIGALIENDQSAAGWSGPYLPYTKTNSISLNAKVGSTSFPIYMYRNAGDDWSTTLTDGPIRCSAATKGCYEWVMVYAYNADLASATSQLFKDLDEKYDNSDGESTGNIRYRSYSATNQRIHIKGLLRGQKDEV